MVGGAVMAFFGVGFEIEELRRHRGR
jgi:hypothetical protein